MLEKRGDLWTFQVDYRCITTNGFVKKNGEAVMGRGCAKQAATRWPGLPRVLGDLIHEYGNVTQEIGYSTLTDGEIKHCAWDLVSFPVKHHWREKADLALIERSAHQLVELVNEEPDPDEVEVVIPRPGCGNGQLDWEDVEPVIEPILDDRFTIITYQ